MTCSSPINSSRRFLRTGPWRPPLRELTKTTMGASRTSSSLRQGPCFPTSSTATAAAVAPGSLDRMASAMAARRRSGMVILRRRYSLSSLAPAIPHALNDSTSDALDDADDVIVIVVSTSDDAGNSGSLNDDLDIPKEREQEIDQMGKENKIKLYPEWRDLNFQDYLPFFS